MDIRPIKTEADYEWALKEIEAYFDQQPEVGSPAGNRFDVLATLIEAYEDKHFPIDEPTPIEAIKSRMQQKGLSRKDLEPMIGGRGRVSEVLKQKRPLSITMIRRLSYNLDIPAAVLLQPVATLKKRAVAKRRVADPATAARSSKAKSSTSASR
jgi:HTH-type transcriptional regulator / antitoxin HigA